MAEVLYRKYRPINFSEVEGQEHVVPILKESILQGKVSHAYLFCGPRGCGKTTIARIMAKAVNCKNFQKTGDICNECEYCTAINNSSVDVIEMDAASNRGIEEIRAVRDTVNFVPNFLAKKIYIIDEAHMLTKEAFNALLKTLEEPPEHIVFIMATTEAHKLPVTILSRVTRFDFKLGTEKEVIKKLSKITKAEGYKIDTDGLKLIYKASGGSFRDSESLLTKIILTSADNEITTKDVLNALGISDLKLVEEFIEYFQKEDLNAITASLKSISDNDGNVVNFLEQILQVMSERLVEDSKKGLLNNKLLDLANLIIGLKSDVRDFNDKLTVINLEFLKYFSKEAKTITSTETIITQVVSTKETSKSASAEPSKIVELKPAEISSFISKLIELSEGVLPRLKGIINTSKIEIETSEIKIGNPYKFNIAYMSKKEARDIFMNAAESVYGKKLGLSFSIISDVVPAATKKESPEKPNSDKIVESKKKLDRSQDNSSLVEELF